MEREMFYHADPLIFERAKELRNNMTHTEMMMWGYLRTGPFGCKFRRQHPLYNYIADFYCHSLKLVIEVDGSIHYKEEVKKKDIKRENIIRSLGIEMLRFTNNEVLYKLDVVIITINNFIRDSLTKKIKKGPSTSPLGGRGVCML